MVRDASSKTRRRPMTAAETFTHVEPSARAAALEQVDTALSFAARRSLMSAAEAVQLFQGVRIKVSDDETGRVVDATLASAVASYRAQAVVERSLVVDQLLDLRLTISG
jgi:hypothetical protein